MKNKSIYPLILYGIKVLVEKFGKTGVRVDAGVVYEAGTWKHHMQFGEYRSACNCDELKGLAYEG